jgi:hypothetical protein
MSSSRDETKLLDLVRQEIGRDTNSLPDADLKSFVDFIRSDKDGERALQSLLDPERDRLGPPVIDCCNTSGFQESTPAQANLSIFMKLAWFCLYAKEINKEYKGQLKSRSAVRTAHALDDSVDGILYYNNADDLEGPCDVVVKEWIDKPNSTMNGQPPRHCIRLPLCASFYRPAAGNSVVELEKRERIACFVSSLAATADKNGRFTILGGSGEWRDVNRHYYFPPKSG